MKHVSILVPNGPAVLSSIVGPYKVLNKVNDFLISQGKDPYYDIEIVGLDKTYNYYNDIFSVKCTKCLDEVTETDLIIISTPFEEFDSLYEANLPLIEWIKEKRQNGSEVASLCMAAILLGFTGLLDGKKASTHWMAADAFRQMFPQVDLQSQHIITEDDGIYTSGGAYSFLNLVIYFVEKYNSREMAQWISKVFEIEYGRNSQGQFAIFNGQKSHTDDSILKSQEFIEHNYADSVSLDRLAEITNLSRRNFIRRFKKATSHTPGEYIKRIRVEAAKRILELKNSTVSEAMYEVGYNDSKAFRKTFKKVTGCSPSDYKSKFSREPLILF